MVLEGSCADAVKRKEGIISSRGMETTNSNECQFEVFWG